jgi:hypothetical protein
MRAPGETPRAPAAPAPCLLAHACLLPAYLRSARPRAPAGSPLAVVGKPPCPASSHARFFPASPQSKSPRRGSRTTAPSPSSRPTARSTSCPTASARTSSRWCGWSASLSAPRAAARTTWSRHGRSSRSGELNFFGWRVARVGPGRAGLSFGRWRAHRRRARAPFQPQPGCIQSHGPLTRAVCPVFQHPLGAPPPTWRSSCRCRPTRSCRRADAARCGRAPPRPPSLPPPSWACALPHSLRAHAPPYTQQPPHPTPPNPSLNLTLSPHPPPQGSAQYVPEKNAMVWTIKSFPGGKVRSSRQGGGAPLGSPCGDPRAPPPCLAPLRGGAGCCALAAPSPRLAAGALFSPRPLTFPPPRHLPRAPWPQEYLLRVNFNLPSVEAEEEVRGAGACARHSPRPTRSPEAAPPARPLAPAPAPTPHPAPRHQLHSIPNPPPRPTARCRPSR